MWNALDSGLELHLALEERLILLEFAKVDPVEAEVLTREQKNAGPCIGWERQGNAAD